MSSSLVDPKRMIYIKVIKCTECDFCMPCYDQIVNVKNGYLFLSFPPKRMKIEAGKILGGFKLRVCQLRKSEEGIWEGWAFPVCSGNRLWAPIYSMTKKKKTWEDCPLPEQIIKDDKLQKLRAN